MARSLEPRDRVAGGPQVRRAGRFAVAGLPAHAAPRLRHAPADPDADTRLIQDYLGHRNIQHTVRYTVANPARFERLWR